MKLWPWSWERWRQDLHEELQSHLRMTMEDHVARGESPDQAHAAAAKEMGNLLLVADATRPHRGWEPAERFAQSVRYALRQLRRSPGFAITAILGMALGIGPVVAIFSMIWATFLAPLPYPNANQLVVVWGHYKGERAPTSGEDYAQLAAQNHSFQSLSFQSWIALHLTNADHAADQEAGLACSPGLQTRTVRQPMLLGRDFLPDEGSPGNDHVVIFSSWLWRHRYNSDPNIVGKSILIEDQPYTVVGVLRPSPHENGGGVEFNVPVRLTPGQPSRQFGIMIGRLKPGATLAQAQAELSVINNQIARQHGAPQGTSPYVLTVEHFRNDWLDLKTQRNLWLLLYAVGLVLLIACANIANLLLARGTTRTQELAVRSALGATRSQIFMQLFTESLTIAIFGGAIGIALGWAIMKLSIVLLPNLALEATDALVEMNLPVLGFSILIALLAGVIAGCAPSWRSARINQNEALKQGSRAAGGRGRTRLQSALVITEIALSLVLLAGAGMALHSFWNLSHIDVGFRADHVLTAELRPRENGPGGKPSVSSPEEASVQQHQLLDRVRQIPGVADAAGGIGMPMEGANSFRFEVANQTVDKDHMPTADLEAVTPSFFRTFGIRLVRGRFFGEEDGLQSPRVVMVNETFVRRYLANCHPLNQKLLLRIPVFRRANPGPTQIPAAEEFQIIGIFHDVLNNEHLTGEVQPQMYVSQWQVGWPLFRIAVRTLAIDPETITTTLQRTVSSVMPGAAIDHVRTMTDNMEQEQSSDRFEMILFGAFAAVALLLAVIGIYGVMSFAVVQRTHEMGVRMALGAQYSEVIRLIVGSGMRLSLLGLGIGLAGAVVLGRLMHATLYGVQVTDFYSLTAVTALLFFAALLACWIPARRSAAIDPMQALRNE
ncbi:MAG: ABC transporter permease [Terracidiphilus sp.]